MWRWKAATLTLMGLAALALFGGWAAFLAGCLLAPGWWKLAAFLGGTLFGSLVGMDHGQKLKDRRVARRIFYTWMISNGAGGFILLCLALGQISWPGNLLLLLGALGLATVKRLLEGTRYSLNQVRAGHGRPPLPA